MNINLLDSVQAPHLTNTSVLYHGHDSPDSCQNKKYFNSYPDKISYQFNSRGFRDQEWPDDLKSSVWCIGDSETVGVGLPFADTWVQQLSRLIKTNCINISVLAVSNHWIYNHANTILNVVQPMTMVIHWSFVHRRPIPKEIVIDRLIQESYLRIRDNSWPAEIRTLADLNTLPENIYQEFMHNHKIGYTPTSLSEFLNLPDQFLHALQIDTDRKFDDPSMQQTLDLIETLTKAANNTKIVHSFIGNFIDKKSKKDFIKNFKEITNQDLIECFHVDYGRDYIHYGPETSQNLAISLAKEINYAT